MSDKPSLSRKIKESPLFIGKNEVVPYTLTFAGFVPTGVTALSSPVVTLHDVTNGETNAVDVSSTKLTGSPSFADLVMTLPKITGLAKNKTYLLRCRGTGGGGTYEQWAEVKGEW